MTLPVVHLEGTPFDQGRQHGAALREQIAHNLAVYYDRFLREGQLARRRGAPARRALPAAAGDVPRLLRDHARRRRQLGPGADRHGHAERALRAAVLPVQRPAGRRPRRLHRVRAPARGHPERAPADRRELGLDSGSPGRRPAHARDVELHRGGHRRRQDWPERRGLGLVVNGLLSTSDDWSRLVKPFHVRCYEVLRSRRSTRRRA